MKKAIIGLIMFGLIMMYVSAETPDCGDYINESIVFDSDINCSGYEIALLIEGQNNLVVNCNGYAIIMDNIGINRVLSVTDDSSNITIKNCVFHNGNNLLYAEDVVGLIFENNTIIGTEVGIDEGYLFYCNMVNNSIIRNNYYNISFDTEVGYGQGSIIILVSEEESLDSIQIYDNEIISNLSFISFMKTYDYTNVNITRNKFTTSTDYLFYIDETGDDGGQFFQGNIYNNNFYANNLVNVADGEILTEPFNLTQDVLFGNYYSFNAGCDDIDSNGICDDPVTDNYSVWDGYPLADPYSSCTPDWSCSGYSSCNISDLSPCNDTTDNNVCGLPYSGDYSEFSPQSCNYCSADEEITSTTPCQNNYQYVYVIDNNFETCCNITGLVSDCLYGNESTDSYPQSCSVFDYDDNDIPASMVDVIVKFILSIGIFIGIMLFALVGTWAFRHIKGKK